MKKFLLMLLPVIMLVSGCAGTAKIRRPSVSEVSAGKVALPTASLTVGEKFTFLVAWKGIPVGRATATVESLMNFKEYEVYKVVVTAKTNKFLSKLFRVEDTFTSYVDKEKLISRHYEAIIREGRYKKDLVVDYDLDRGIAINTNLLDGTVKESPIEKDVHDPISAAYSLRTMPIKVGDEVRMTVNLNEKNYKVIADVEKAARIDLPKVGEFGAFLIRPYVILEGKRQKRGKAWGYLSTDKKRLAAYIAVRVLEIPWIGEVTATLEKVEYR
ncbi:MAG: DUF3108 domain-containing protein [Omnitrophica bacterium]|nr:DUF3108 domain-containing protein [Candidatus Omnitrophota bacterium]